MDIGHAFAAHRERVAVVVTDMAMPRLDGLGLIRKIREQGSRVPIVVMTGAISSEQIAECKSLGVSEFLRKPKAARRQSFRQSRRVPQRQLSLPLAEARCRAADAAV